MTEKQIIERLMARAKAARAAQNYYFKNRNGVNLNLSKKAEAELDQYLVALEKSGYRPEDIKNSEQKNIF